MPPLLYFGHPINTYGTDLELVLLDTIRRRFKEAKIVNPNTLEHERGYKQGGMQYFVDLVGICDGGVFLPFPDGAWSAGVHLEAETMWKLHKHVWVISCDGRIMDVRNFEGVRALNQEETSDRLYVPPAGENGLKPYLYPVELTEAARQAVIASFVSEPEEPRMGTGFVDV